MLPAFVCMYVVLYTLVLLCAVAIPLSYECYTDIQVSRYPTLIYHHIKNTEFVVDTTQPRVFVGIVAQV